MRNEILRWQNDLSSGHPPCEVGGSGTSEAAGAPVDREQQGFGLSRKNRVFLHRSP